MDFALIVSYLISFARDEINRQLFAKMFCCIERTRNIKLDKYLFQGNSHLLIRQKYVMGKFDGANWKGENNCAKW